jgi:hypothetical protein
VVKKKRITAEAQRARRTQRKKQKKKKHQRGITWIIGLHG